MARDELNMQRVLDLYLITTRRNRYILFCPTDIVEQCEVASGDRIHSVIAWVKQRPNRFVAWVGRALQAAHGHYVKLEDRIDPVERVLKAIACSAELTVNHAASIDESEARARFQSILRKQRMKHLFWLSIDSLLTAVVVAFTPILAPIPGPNVFFYYPALRLLSHYRAFRGATSALGSMPVRFKSLRDFSGLEENLRGLNRFLERMV